MIYTCTMNPSLDYFMEFDTPARENGSNRSQLEYYEAGGKGINVSIVLSNLGIPTRALGFVGGFTKDFYISLLAKYEEILPYFTYIHGHTRVNVKCMGEMPAELNATGPYITDKDMKNLMKKAERLAGGDYFVYAGITQEYLIEDAEDMLKSMIDEGTKVVIHDTNAEIARDMAEYKPFMITSTSAELANILGDEGDPAGDVIANAKKLHEMGAEHVLVNLDRKKALLVTGDGCYECEFVHQGKAVNTVGTGDSMVAGFLMNYLRTRDAVDSLRFSASCGAATAYSKGLATRESIDSFYKTTNVEKID